MKKTQNNQIFRRDFLKGLTALPFLGYFGFAFKDNIEREIQGKKKDSRETLGIDNFDATSEKLSLPTGNESNRIRIGLIGHGWRGEALLNSFGYFHPEYIEQMKKDNLYDQWVPYQKRHEDLFVDITGICDTFGIHAQRGMEVAQTDVRHENSGSRLLQYYPNYRELIASKDIDAIIVATPDHTHAQIAMEAARAGKHIYLEKPMAHTIEEAIELRNAIRETGVVLQVGHENRQQMSFKLGRELYQKGVLGTVSMIQTYTNRNTLFGAWIRERKFDHLGTPENINWKEFLGKAPWVDFDAKRYFNWHRYNDYGTGITGNDFSHTYDCINQVLDLGIPESVVALGGQYYYNVGKDDMPDVFNAIFNYPERGLTMTYDGTLKSGIYRQSRILGSEATMDIDRSIMLYKDPYSERFKDAATDPDDPFYYYAPNTNANVDGMTSATSKSYLKSGYGPTFIDGKVIDATFLHLKEWIDTIRTQGKASCNEDKGLEETVTFCMANLSYALKKPIHWNKVNETIVIG